ncbi:MAG: hypothetical protein K2N54_04115 [Helicobacter sp.]|nr:hypothetical protein [Helicobacter sp.]
MPTKTETKKRCFASLNMTRFHNLCDSKKKIPFAARVGRRLKTRLRGVVA